MFKRKRKKTNFGMLKEDKFNFEHIKKYFENNDKSNYFFVFDNRLCNDIDFNELFSFLDRTVSKVGQQYLYSKLRTVKYPNNNHSEEKIIDLLSSDENMRNSLHDILSQLNNQNSYYISSLISEAKIQPPKFFFLIKLLSLASFAFTISAFFIPSILIVLIPVMLVNLGFHYWNKRNIMFYVSSLPELLKLGNVAKKIANLKQLNNYLSNIKKDIQKINALKKKLFYFKLENKINSEFESFFWGIFEFLKILFLIEPIVFYNVLDDLKRNKNEIHNVFKFVGKIDSLYSIANVRYTSEYCIPKIIDYEQHIEFNDIYHPLILDCTNNNLKLKNKSILLTGSNMSGKTTFIRTIAVNLITSYTINTAFATNFLVPIAKLYSVIRINDDLLNNKSYYFEEVITIKKMLDYSKSNYVNIFLLDELFKGTNTIERVSAGRAVLNELAKNNIVFVSTHDIELADMLKENYDLYHFTEIVKNDKVDFDYKLRSGIVKEGNAIKILLLNNYPQSVIQEAIKTSEAYCKK